MNDHPRLATPRLVLEPVGLQHTQALHEVFADAEAMRFWHEAPHASDERTRTMIGALVGGTERAWALLPREGGGAIGLVYYLGNPGAPGMGYILSPRHWRQGLMSEAVEAALAYGFETLKLDRVELWIDARNVPSQRLAERAGFRRRGAFRQKYAHEAASHEKLVYGLRLEEWRPNARAEVQKRPIEAYSLQPILAVADVRATAEYYRDKLGFEITFLFGDPPTYAGVRLAHWMATGAVIHLSRTEALPPVAGLALYVDIGPGIDALHASFAARGVTMLGEVLSQPWGQREFAIRDCNGYTLRFGTPG